MVAAKTITVCQLLHSLNVGGAEMLAARLSRRLRERFRFVFACLDEIGPLGDSLQREGFSVHSLHRRTGLDLRCSLRLAKLLRSERIDVIHAHQYTPFFYGLLGRYSAQRQPILFTEHGRHQPDYPRPKRIMANRLLLSRRDRVVGVGAAVRQALITNEGIPAPRVEVVYNGVDVGAFGAPSCDRNSARQSLSAGPEELVIVQVARLDYLKDHATAIRTIARVATSEPRVRLVLIGDGPERANIMSEISTRGLENRIRLLGTRMDVDRLLPAADMFLLTSTSEGIPLTVIEAMAAGLPIVATKVGGVGEVVEDNSTGLLASSGDDAGLAQHIIRLAQDPNLRSAMGIAGAARARRFFDEQRMCEEYDRLYRSMLRARAPLGRRQLTHETVPNGRAGVECSAS